MTRDALIKAVKKVMAERHSIYFLRWEIRNDGAKDMSDEVAAMFVDELISPVMKVAAHE